MLIRQANEADAPGIARVRVDTWRSAYKGIISDDYLHSLSYAESARQFQTFLECGPDEYVIWVAEDSNGEIAGFVCGGPERRTPESEYGEIYALYVRDAFQGQGIGRRLVAACAAILLESGKTALMLWVLADNPHRTFYEALQGEVSGHDVYTVQNQDAPLFAYEWKDIRRLISG